MRAIKPIRSIQNESLHLLFRLSESFADNAYILATSHILLIVSQAISTI